MSVNTSALAQPTERPAPDPSVAVLQIRQAQLDSRAGSQPVTLPHVLQATDFVAEGSRVRYVLELALPAAPAQPLGIFIAKASLGAQLYLNGQWVGACANGPLESLRCLHRSWLLAPPPGVWRAGLNRLEVEIHANDRQTNGLSSVRVGPLDQLDREYQVPQDMLKVQLLRALTWVTASLGLLCLVVAAHLGRRDMYLWTGLASVANALSHINFLSLEAWPTPELFSWFAFSTRMVSAPLMMMACVAFYGRDRPWQHALALGYAFAAPVLVWLSGGDRGWVTLYYLPMLVLGPLIVVAMARWTWQSRRVTHVLMLATTLVLFLAAIGDWQRLRGASAFEGVYAMAYASASFLVLMASLLMAELASGLLKSRELTATLEHKVAEREEQLQDIYQEREQAVRAQAMIDERERLLADMHDSLGAGLGSALLMLRQGQLNPQDAAHVVQECIDDLRLVFDVSAHLEEDLQALVADVRHRLQNRLAGVGLHTQWDLALQGVPALGSTRCLQLMRVLQEALTNAMRHAQASELQIRLHWRAGPRWLLMQVRDNGKGMSEQTNRRGRGLSNMARRASSLGAELDIRPAHPGTLVELRLQL